MEKTTNIESKEAINAQYKVYGADWCPACKKAKELMEKHNIDFDYLIVSEDGNKEQLKETLNNPTRLTIPQIFITDDHGNEQHYIGGYDDFRDMIQKATR